MKKKFWIICYGVALSAFTAYIALDTFVLSSAYQRDATQMNTAMFADTEESLTDTEEPSTDNEESSIEKEESLTEKEKSSTDTEKSSTGKKKSSSEEKKSSSEKEESSSESDEKEKADTTDKPTHKSRHGFKHKSYAFEGSDDSSDSTVSKYSLTESGSSYENENVKITITEYDQNNTKIYVADVQVDSAQELKTAFAEDTYGKNVTEKTSEIAESKNAILAINGDYYGARESGYVIRNGVVYRDEASDDDLLCIYADGSMKILNQSDYSAEELVSQGVWQAFSFGPGLIENGDISVNQDDEVGRAKASNPRTAIGVISENHYLFVVSDGRTDESEGLTLYELAEFMKSLGARTAYNLDGGGSSTMYFNGAVVNNPTTTGNIKEREVSDIVYIGQ